MAYTPSIQNGRLVKHRRNAYFNIRLYRVSEVIQHPTWITFREFCGLVWLMYALVRGFFCARSIQTLVGYVDVNRLCGPGQSFYDCSWIVAWRTFDIVWIWLGEVVPWAILCVAVAFVGEVVMSLTAGHD